MTALLAVQGVGPELQQAVTLWWYVAIILGAFLAAVVTYLRFRTPKGPMVLTVGDLRRALDGIPLWMPVVCLSGNRPAWTPNEIVVLNTRYAVLVDGTATSDVGSVLALLSRESVPDRTPLLAREPRWVTEAMREPDFSRHRPLLRVEHIPPTVRLVYA